jgi:hypothetical protein
VKRREWNEPHDIPEVVRTECCSLNGEREWMITVFGDEFRIKLTAEGAEELARNLMSRAAIVRMDNANERARSGQG